MSVKKAIIPCAGFGTRFLPVTKVLPKELLPIVDTPALSYIVDEAVASGIEEIVIVISPQKEDIRRLFEPNVALNARLEEVGDKESYLLANKSINAKISFVTQETMNGNANAILLCKKFANGEPVAVLFGDDVMYSGSATPVTKQLIDAYEKTGGTIVGCQQTPEDVARRCGVMIVDKPVSDKITKIKGIIEKPQGEIPSKLVSLGRFILSPDIFDAIEKNARNERRSVSHRSHKFACGDEGRIRLRVRSEKIRHRQQRRLSRSHDRIRTKRRKSQKEFQKIHRKHKGVKRNCFQNETLFVVSAFSVIENADMRL